MAHVEIYEHEQYNSGEVPSDKNGAKLVLQVSIPNMSSIIVNGTTIQAFHNQAEIPPGTEINFNKGVSSFKTVGVGATFYDNINYTGNFSSAAANTQNSGFNDFNDATSSIKLSAEAVVPAVNVASCQVDPTSVQLGTPFKLIVNLDNPAPSSGVTIVISYESNGAMDTLVASPVSITVAGGLKTGSITVQTQPVAGAAMKIVFSAKTAGGIEKSADLNLFP